MVHDSREEMFEAFPVSDAEEEVEFQRKAGWSRLHLAHHIYQILTHFRMTLQPTFEIGTEEGQVYGYSRFSGECGCESVKTQFLQFGVTQEADRGYIQIYRA